MSNFIPDSPVVADSGRWKPVVRGFAEGSEVLTEFGWVDFRAVFGGEFLGGSVPFRGNGFREGGFGVKDLRWGQWETTVRFPRVASVDPVSGGVVFVRPERFMFFEYEGRLVHVKLRGVDVVCSLFTDLWVKPKYGRSWRFVLADDMVRNRHSGTNYQLLNKFNFDLYGDWSPVGAGVLGEGVVGLGGLTMGVDGEGGLVDGGVLLPRVGGGFVEGLSSGLVCDVGSPIVVVPKRAVSRRRVWDLFDYDTVVDGVRVVADRVRVDVSLFNLVVPPFHNFVVRKGKEDPSPRVRWVGGPVVVGDGLDKSLLRVGSVSGSVGSGVGLTAGSGGVGLDAGVLGVSGRVVDGGGSYGGLRPDYRDRGRGGELKDRG